MAEATSMSGYEGTNLVVLAASVAVAAAAAVAVAVVVVRIFGTAGKNRRLFQLCLARDHGATGGRAIPEQHKEQEKRRGKKSHRYENAVIHPGVVLLTDEALKHAFSEIVVTEDTIDIASSISAPRHGQTDDKREGLQVRQHDSLERRVHRLSTPLAVENTSSERPQFHAHDQHETKQDQD